MSERASRLGGDGGLSDLAPESADMNDMVILPAQLEDVELIVEIDAEVTGTRKADFWYGRYVQQKEDASLTLLVGRVGDEVAGYVLASIKAWEFGSYPCGWIEAITVSPRHRKAMVATRLFEAAVAFFQQNGITTVRTMVHIDANELISFFRLQGMAAGPYIELEMHTD